VLTLKASRLSKKTVMFVLCILDKVKIKNLKENKCNPTERCKEKKYKNENRNGQFQPANIDTKYSGNNK
jgi:hypothetical protein